MDLFSCEYLMYDSEINKFRFKQDMGDIKFFDIWGDYLKLLSILTNFDFRVPTRPPGVKFSDKQKWKDFCSDVKCAGINVPDTYYDNFTLERERDLVNRLEQKELEVWGSYERFNNRWMKRGRIINPIKSPEHQKQNYTDMDVFFLYKLYLKAKKKKAEEEGAAVVSKRDENKNYREKVTEINEWLQRNTYKENMDYFENEGQLAMNLNEESIIVSLLDDKTRMLIKLSMDDKLNNTTPNVFQRLELLAFCTGLLDNDSTLSYIDIDIIPIIAGFLYGKEEGEKKYVPPTGGGKNKRRKTKRRKSKKIKSKKRKKTKRR